MKLKSLAASRKGQTLVEYILLMAIAISAMLALSKVLTQGYGSLFEKYKTVMEYPHVY